ncbi:hypothetical protein ACLB2K_022414 [Fragaria x ananassa]
MRLRNNNKDDSISKTKRDSGWGGRETRSGVTRKNREAVRREREPEVREAAAEGRKEDVDNRSKQVPLSSADSELDNNPPNK